MFLQSTAEAAGESVGQLIFYVALIVCVVFIYIKMRNRNRNK